MGKLFTKIKNRKMAVLAGFSGRIFIQNFSSKKIERYDFMAIAKHVAIGIPDNYLVGNNIINVNIINSKIGKNKEKEKKNIKNVPDKMIMRWHKNLLLEVISKKEEPNADIITERRSEVNKKKLKGNNKVLFFKNIFSSEIHELNLSWISPATHYLASAVLEGGDKIVLSDSKIVINSGDFITKKDELKKILKENRDINFVAITLCEGYFDKIRELVGFIRKNSDAFIAVGGVMPTLTPEHVFVHLSDADFVIRGSGEKILPSILNIIDGYNAKTGLKERQIKKLSLLDGVLYSQKNIFISGNIDKTNKIENFNDSLLRFDFFKKEDVRDGLNLYTSRGCNNYCVFCTIPGHGRFSSKSAENLIDILNSYQSRLSEIYNGFIPPKALALSFNDDDFLTDSGRVLQFFDLLKKTDFKINFFQTGINSFFERKKKGAFTDNINKKLINGITPEIFYKEDGNNHKKTDIYIGTENYDNNELGRLGKGYEYEKIEKVVKELSNKKIFQAHHFIVSNINTPIEALFENLEKILILRIKYHQYFNVLLPPIKYLVSLFPSLSYRRILQSGDEKCLSLKKTFLIKNHPEYNYPAVERDNPRDEMVGFIAAVIDKRFINNSANNIARCIDDFLVFLICAAENLRKGLIHKKKHLRRIIERHVDYPKIVYKKTGVHLFNNIGNLQLMITNRCQPHYKYCPVIKGYKDMNEKILKKSIDLLFSSSRSDLRLDFTGGEPLLRFDLLKKGVEYAQILAKKTDKRISFYMVSNFIILNDEMADFLKKEKFTLEVSIDDYEDYHNLYKIGKSRGINSYQATAAALKKIIDREIYYQAVMVVSPESVKHLFKNFSHVYDFGAKRVGINYALGFLWNSGQMKEFIRQIRKIKKNFGQKIKKGLIALNNLDNRVEPAILNVELLVAPDGTINFLSDRFFTRESGKKIPPIANVEQTHFLEELSVGKALALARLFKYQGGVFRNIVLNNILFGEKVRKEIISWKI